MGISKCGMSCGHEFCIKKVPVFKKLEPAQMAQVAKLIRRKELSPKATLYEEGEELSSLVIIRYGKIKLTRLSADGKETLLDIVGVGDFYGGDILFEKGRAKETSMVLEPTGVCFIDAVELKELLKKEPDIALRILEYYCTYSNQQKELLEILSVKSSLKRVAMFLAMRSERIGMETLELTQLDIANSINLTQETVNRKLSELKKMKLIETEGQKKIKLLDIPTLKDLI